MSLRATGDTPRGRHLHRPGNSPQRLAKRPHERETLRRIFPKRTTYDVHRDPHAGAGARRTGIIHGDLSSRRRRPRLPLLLPRRPPGRRPHRRPAGGLRHPGLAGRAGAGPGWVAAGGGPWRGSEHARGSWLWRQGVRGFCVLHVAEAWVTAPGSAYTIRQGKHCRRRRVGRALRPPQNRTSIRLRIYWNARGAFCGRRRYTLRGGFCCDPPGEEASCGGLNSIFIRMRIRRARW